MSDKDEEKEEVEPRYQNPPKYYGIETARGMDEDPEIEEDEE